MRIVRCGFEPVLRRTHHETSDELIAAMKEKKLKYEIVLRGLSKRSWLILYPLSIAWTKTSLKEGGTYSYPK